MRMISKKELQFAKELGKHKGKWVAMYFKERRIIASGKTLETVQRQLAKKGVKDKDYVFHLVPTKPFIGYEA